MFRPFVRNASIHVISRAYVCVCVHCCMLLWSIKDVGSKLKTCVNNIDTAAETGDAQEEVALKDGDEVKLGTGSVIRYASIVSAHEKMKTLTFGWASLVSCVPAGAREQKTFTLRMLFVVEVYCVVSS